MTRCSVEPRTRKYIKRHGFLLFARNLSNKKGKKVLDTAAKTGLDAAKDASKKIVDKTAEATGELIGNKIAGKVVKPDENSKNVEEINILPGKRQEY